MGTETKIEWTDHTFNPWIGCTKVSPGCTNCYAEAMNHRWGHERWGVGAKREHTSVGYWRQAKRWNQAALEEGRRHRVFCASQADVFDAEVPDGWRLELFSLIRQTPQLDWQLLTKRPERFHTCLVGAQGIVARHSTEAIGSDTDFEETRLWLAQWASGKAPRNVWVGASTESQRALDDRLPYLQDIPAVVHFLSCEPLLERVFIQSPARRALDWVIVGGESGPRARMFHLDWARHLVEQCRASGVAVFVKQLGDVPVMDEAEWRRGETTYTDSSFELRTRVLSHRNRNKVPMGSGLVPLLLTGKAGDPAEWPEDLRVRQWPGHYVVDRMSKIVDEMVALPKEPPAKCCERDLDGDGNCDRHPAEIRR